MRALAPAVLLLAACAGAPAPEPQTAPPEPPSGWRARAELELERQAGRKIDARIASQLGFYGERRIADYVESVGRNLARGATRREVDYSFKIIDDASANAFAAPAGFIYVTRGLLAQLSSEAELAAVLAHELAHVERRHGLRESAWEDERAASWTRADTLRFYDRSRDNEREADLLAIQSLERAGYTPAALSAAFRRLQSVESGDEPDPDDPRGWLSSHPSMTARIARAQHAAARTPGRVGRSRHLAAIDRLTFGDNPHRGYLHGRSWVLPTARLAFELPNGWQAHASSSTLWVAPDDGSGFMLLMRAGQQPELTAANAWQHTLEVAGRSARWMTIEVDDDHRGSFASIELDGEVLLVVAAVAPGASAELEQWPRLFRRVDDPELLGRRPLRLVIARPARATTLARLARRSPVPLEALVRLNGLAALTPIAPGTSIKLIVR
jgi:predicted Zn-dependent protease